MPLASDAMYDRFCDLPGIGSVHVIGMEVIAGGRETERLSFMQLPSGFCGHFFANVATSASLRLHGRGALRLHPRPAHDGRRIGAGGDRHLARRRQGRDIPKSPSRFCKTFLRPKASCFGLRSLYYQDATAIMRRPYATGDRQPSTPIETVANIQVYMSPGHWPKPLDKPTTARSTSATERPG